MKSRFLQRASLALFAIALGAVAFATPRPAPAADPAATSTLPPYQSLTPVRLLGYIRRVYRMRRPPPAYEAYTLVRKQNTNYGYPDLAESYTKHYWVRNTDRAALVRMVYRDDTDGPPTFDRPALNQPRDPGPATADLFEPAHPQPINLVPTPEPTLGPLKTIGSVVAIGESDYNVPKVTVEGDMLHLILEPRRDPERNVLREIWADKHSYVLRKLIAHDRLFAEGDGIYPVKFTYTLGYLDGYVVITHLDGVVLPIQQKDKNGGTVSERVFSGDGQTVTFDFEDISFPSTLPAWYFDPSQYGSHVAEAPL